MVDYQEIIKNLENDKIIKLMESLGANRYIDKDSYIIFPTICHNSDSEEASMKLYFYKDTKLFVCYTECGNMSIFKFLKHYYENRGIDYDWFQDVLNVVLNCSLESKKLDFSNDKYVSLKERYDLRKNRKELDKIPHGLLDIFTKYYPAEWQQDNISKKAMDKYNIKFSISQNKIIIPHYDVNNNLIGIRGRALNQWEVENIGKYMPVQIEQKWYSHPLSLNLYGLNFNKENIKKYGIVYLFEAEKSVLQCENFSFPNCSCAVCGSQFNKFQLDLLMRYCKPKEIVICFDKEEKDGQDDYFNKLWKMASKYTNYSKISFIYDRENMLELKDSPSDKGEEIFTELLKRRVFVL